jgi:iron complex outermembrane receptor protein
MRKITPRFFRNFCVFLILLLSSGIAYAQTGVSGKITDANGAGVPGITVTAKGTNAATATDADGNFSLTVPAGARTLVVSGLNYQTQELAIGSQTNFNVSLQPAGASDLNEVVVVGYGTARRKDLVGSTVNVGSKDFQKGAITTPEQLILGKVAGVNITSNSGEPGSGSTIRIRGGASLSASNDPLIIIDGVQLSGGGIAGSANFLATINPNDIESFSILKDASAAAIYGSRASNGVIIITTKKGKAGKTRINFNSQLSVGAVSKQMEVLSAEQFREFVQANGNANQIAQLGTATTNWQDEIYQRALGTDNNISVSGSTKGMIKLPYRVSAGYYNQEGILKTGELQRFSGSLNLSPSFFDNHLKVELNVKGSNSKSRFAPAVIGDAVRFNPTVPVRTGYYRFGGFFEYLDPNSTTGLKALSPSNPIGQLAARDNRSNVNRSVGNLQLDYKFHFFPDLRLHTNVGYDIAKGTGEIIVSDSLRSSYMRGDNVDNLKRGGERNQYKQKIENKLLEAYFNYNKDAKSIRSRFDITAGYGYYDNAYLNYSFADYFLDGSKRKDSDPLFAFDKPQNRLISFYGKFNYTFNNKYIIEVNGRRDGSSRLNPDNRWINYHSEALAWRISEESFLKNSKVISDLKIRAGYGITGQQDGISNYSYLARYTQSNNTALYQLGDVFYNMYRPEAYNPTLTWEQTATTNLALDFGLFNNRINGSVDFYLKKTKDLLNEVGQAAGANFAPVALANVGNMENKGVEFSVNTQIVQKKDLTVEFGFNATYNRNRITKLTFSEDPDYEGMRYGGIAGGTGGTILVNSVGYNRGSFFVYKQVYDETGKPLDNVFEDLNRDGVITEKDLYRYKSANPDVFMGFTGNVTFKKWNAGFIARASFGNYMYNNVASSTGTIRNILDPLGYLANGSTDVLKTNFSGSGDKYIRSDYYVQNASFFRMDNINMGYNFGKVFNSKADMRFNASLQNVFVVTKYKGADPENGGGIDNNFYPRPRTLVLGVNLDF